MATVVREGGESIEGLIQRFRKLVQQDGILTEARRRRWYEKPSQTRKRNAARKLRKSRRTTLKDKMRRY